jgi:hypothetical protein
MNRAGAPEIGECPRDGLDPGPDRSFQVIEKSGFDPTPNERLGT